MSYSVRTILSAFVVCLLVSSCNDQSTSIRDLSTNNNTANSQKTTEILGEFPTINRYDLDIEIDRSLTLEQLGSIRITATSKLPSDETELIIIMPELDAMEMAMQTRGNTDRIEIPVGQKLPSEREEIAGLGTGQELSKTLELTVSEPGYYSIYATVRLKNAEDPDSYIKDGKYIRNLTSKNLWLWVDEEETKITEEFEEDLIPKKYIVQPGPFTLRGEQSRLHYVSQETSFNKGIPNMQYSQSNDIVITATYMDVTSSTIKPLANADVEFAIYDEYEEDYVGGGTLATNAQGEVSIGCTTTQYWTYEVDFLSENSDVVVYDDNSSNVVRSTSGDYSHCGLSYGVSTSQDRSHVYGIASNVVQDAESFFSESRSKISFSFDPNNGSFYTPGSDAITILHDPNDDSHVGGHFGDFVVAHEYGHAFHEKALDGNEASGSCPQDHYLDGAHNLQCAFSEGFADYFSTISISGFISSEISSNNFYPAQYGDGDPDDGSIIEGAVASFFYDITDNTSESHDSIDLPGSYIADIIIDCEVDIGWTWKRADGIDHLIACFENQLPNYSSYFDTRGIVPNSYDESVSEPSGWSSSGINSLWKHNLYDE